MGWWTSTANNLRRLCRLSWNERVLLFQAALLLPAIAMAVRWLGLGRVRRLLARISPARSINISDAAAIERCTAWAVAAAARHGRFGANCLEQSLLLWWLLRHRGVAAELHFGVRKRARALEAHAWIEVDGRVLIDTIDVRARFSAFDRPIAPATVRLR
jgi:hypothetical protein